MHSQSTRKVYRNGLTFQVPTSIFSPYRYAVHPDGTGSSWTEDAPDIDQPHGLDYRTHQDMRKGIRKRMEHEHSKLADLTVGGKHLPGGCRILGIVENTVDLSVGCGLDGSIDITDGKFQGRGLIYDQTNNALWCYTGDGTVSDDPYLLALNPDRAWGSGDVTWLGNHQFDQSVCFSDGEVTGTWLFEGTVNFDDAVDFSAAIFEGTVGFTDEVDFSDVNLTGSFDIFGSWTSKTNNTTYLADTDGFVVARMISVGTAPMYGYTDSNQTLVDNRDNSVIKSAATQGTSVGSESITMPVKKGDYWKVYSTKSVTALWLPIGK